MLADYDSVTIKGDIVKFRDELAKKALREAKYNVLDYNGDAWLMDAGVHHTTYCDLNSMKLRKPTSRNFINMTKLGDILDTIGSAAVIRLTYPYITNTS